MYAVAVPVLLKASHEVSSVKHAGKIPVVALFSAFSFVIMMFNIPLPGGTTGHAVGATIATVILGPWLAMLAVSVALVIQALFFGDGGILALGANIVNIAVAMPLVVTAVMRAGSLVTGGRRRFIPLLSAISGYVSLNVSAFLTAVTLGIQADLFRSSTGDPLYFPFGVSVAVPAMMIGHLLVAGIAEALVTAVTVSWLLKVRPALFRSQASEETIKKSRFAWGALAILVLLTPIGLIAPGTAWGEWGRDELADMGLGFIPEGFDRFSQFWRSPFPDYEIQGTLPVFGYLLSAIFGITVIFGLLLATGRILSHIRAKRPDRSHAI
jgi:cobalt/nickel transport system permease protein